MEPQSWEATLVRVESAFNVETAGPVRARLAALVSRPGDLILDLRGTTLDSSGLGALLSLQRRLEAQGRQLLVVATDPQFLALLERAGVPGTLSLFADAEQAIRYAQDKPVASC
jgi:anti-anti-sigma factor